MSLYVSFHPAYILKWDSKMNVTSFNTQILLQDCKGFKPCDMTAQWLERMLQTSIPDFNHSLKFDFFYNHLFFCRSTLRGNPAIEGETCFVTVFMKPTRKHSSITLKLKPYSFRNFPQRI